MDSTILTPKNWPTGFSYSPVSSYLGISENLFRHLLSSPVPENKHRIAVCIENQNAHPHLEIRKITDAAHPLAGQYGVFAKDKIPNETELGEYVGEIFSAALMKILDLLKAYIAGGRCSDLLP